MVASSGCNLNALQGNATTIIHFCLSDGMTHESFPAYNGRFLKYSAESLRHAFLSEEGGPLAVEGVREVAKLQTLTEGVDF